MESDRNKQIRKGSGGEQQATASKSTSKRSYSLPLRGGETPQSQTMWLFLSRSFLPLFTYDAGELFLQRVGLKLTKASRRRSKKKNSLISSLFSEKLSSTSGLGGSLSSMQDVTDSTLRQAEVSTDPTVPALTTSRGAAAPAAMATCNHVHHVSRFSERRARPRNPNHQHPPSSRGDAF